MPVPAVHECGVENVAAPPRHGELGALLQLRQADGAVALAERLVALAHELRGAAAGSVRARVGRRRSRGRGLEVVARTSIKYGFRSTSCACAAVSFRRRRCWTHRKIARAVHKMATDPKSARKTTRSTHLTCGEPVVHSIIKVVDVR